MNEKFNKNAKLEKLTTMLGISVRLIVIDPLLKRLDPLQQPNPIHLIIREGAKKKDFIQHHFNFGIFSTQNAHTVHVVN